MPTCDGNDDQGVSMRQLLRGFAIDMQRRNLAPKTIRVRVHAVELLHEHAGHPFGLSPEQIEQFLDRRKLGARARYTWISHLHAFYGWAVRHGHTASDPTTLIVRPKLDRLLPRPIADTDLALALEQASSRTMYAWLMLAAYAGLRCAEIAGLDRANVLDAQGALRILGKGRKERIVPMRPDVRDALRAHGLPTFGPVFRRPTGDPWPPPKVSRRIAVYFDELGIDATAHQLRHWFGTMTYAECKDLRVVQELMGHSSPSSTAGYAAFSRPEALAAVMALPTSLRRAA